jgi:hypothetical protein
VREILYAPAARFDTSFLAEGPYLDRPGHTRRGSDPFLGDAT